MAAGDALARKDQASVRQILDELENYRHTDYANDLARYIKNDLTAPVREASELPPTEREITRYLDGIEPEAFEHLCFHLLRMIYPDGADEHCKMTPPRKDGGLDGWVATDQLGLELIAFEAKTRKDNKITVEEFRSFVGATENHRKKFDRGVFLTTHDFTAGAKDECEQKRGFRLIARVQLIQLLAENSVLWRSNGKLEIAVR